MGTTMRQVNQLHLWRIIDGMPFCNDRNVDQSQMQALRGSTTVSKKAQQTNVKNQTKLLVQTQQSDLLTSPLHRQ